MLRFNKILINGGRFTKRILIVEDEKDLVDLLVYHFQQEGFSVSTALDGRTGWEKAKKSAQILLSLI